LAENNRRIEMAKDFGDLLATMSTERRAEIARRVEEIHSSPLYRIRKALLACKDAEAQRDGSGLSPRLRGSA
jgi:hypothetical protein